MECIRPLRAGWNKAGEVTFNQKDLERGLEGFKLPCRKCIPCLLNMSREKAVRALHEAQTREDSIFLTLTYNDDSLPSDGGLNYPDFQLFMRKLRKQALREGNLERVSYMVTGEFGEETKRPHWHALIFGYRPNDATHQYTNQRGDYVFTSRTIEKLWGHGFINFGQLTLESASYVARYGAKALGHKGNQKYKPKHVTSCRPGLGKKWIEKYYQQTFDHGYVYVNGQKFTIPRYYEDWCKEHQPEVHLKYITGKKQEIIENAEKRQRKEELDYLATVWEREHGAPFVPTRTTVKHKILERKFQRLKEKQSL